MNKVIALDERHYVAVTEKARALGQTPEQYVQALIDADSRTFDEILQPIRTGFDSMADAEIDQLFERASKAARRV